MKKKMTKEEGQQLYELLIKFKEARGSDQVNEDEYDGLTGYIAYCLGDESSFSDPEDYKNARLEASKWLESTIEGKISDYKKIALEKYSAELVTEPLLDEQHLDCIWYGGGIGTFRLPAGKTIEVHVYGEIRLYGMPGTKYENLEYKNKSNSGAVGTDMWYLIKNDQEYDTAYRSGDISIEDNNWIEVTLLDASGNTISHYVDDDDNVLEALDPDGIFEAFAEWI